MKDGWTLWLIIGAIFNQKECPLVHWIYGKLYANNKGPDSRDSFKSFEPFIETDRWPIEVLYAAKRDLLGFIGFHVDCIKKNQGPE